MQEDTISYFDRKTLKEVIYYAISASTCPGIDTSFNYINIVILANKSLAASALTGGVQGAIITTGCSMIGSVCSLTSNAYGHGVINLPAANAKIRHSFKSGLVLTLVLSGPAITFALTSHHILRLLQQPEDLLDDVEQYFKMYSIGIPALFAVHLEKQIALGIADFRAVNLLTVFDNLVVSSLGFLFVNGILGEELGLSGLGLALAITNWLDLLVFSLYLRFSARYSDFMLDLFSEFNEVRQVFFELTSMSIPTGIQVLSEYSINLGYTAFMGKFGEAALKAWQISLQYSSFAAISIYGLNETAIVLVGRYKGAGKIIKAKVTGNICIALGGGISLLLFGVMSSMTHELMRPFLDVEDPNNAEIVTATNLFIIMNSAFQAFDAIRTISGGALLGGFKNTRISMITGLVSVGMIGLGLSYSLGFKTTLGVAGICLARGIGYTLGGCAVLGGWLMKARHWLLTPTTVATSEDSPDMTENIEIEESIEIEKPADMNPKLEIPMPVSTADDSTVETLMLVSSADENNEEIIPSKITEEQIAQIQVSEDQTVQSQISQEHRNSTSPLLFSSQINQTSQSKPLQIESPPNSSFSAKLLSRLRGNIKFTLF